MRSLLLLYTVSGAAGLAWQVLWVRAFTPVFGAGLEAVSAVTATFLAGLGLGARLGENPANPTRRYAALEALVGVWGAALPWVLGHLPPLDGVARLGAAFVLIFPPAIALGATYPAVVAAGAHPGRAYGWNALGAAAGALIAGLWLPWAMGIRGASAALGGLNLLVAGLALRLSTSTPAEAPAAPAEAQPSALRLAFTVGALGLALEVCWTRLASPLLAARSGTDNEAFAGVLAAVLTGIGLGALLGGRFRLGPLLAGLGLSTLAVLEPLRELVLGARHIEEVEACLPLLPAFFLGACFPRLAAEVGSAARVYAANTAGSVLGSLATGFVLLPMVGAQRLAAILATLAFLAGGNRTALLAPLGIVLAVWAPPVAGERVLAPFEDVLEGLDGRETTTLVSRRPDGGLTITSGGHRIDEAGGQAVVDDHALRAQGPASLHADPRRVLSIGLGTGGTARAFLGLDIEALTVVELDGNQQKLSHLFGPLDDPRLELIIGDGRHFLRTDTRRWDLIAVDAYDPRTASAVFYTADFYREAKERLAPGGVLFVKCNPSTFGDPQVLASYLAALFEVWPEGALVSFSRGLYGFVGGSPELRGAKVAARRTPALLEGVRPVTDDWPVRLPPVAQPDWSILEPWQKALRKR